MPTPVDTAPGSYPATFTYEGTVITIDLPSSNEYLGRAIRERQTFYERDVLEACRALLRHESSPFAIVDVGAFCGNHSTYFAKFCRPQLVVACEPTRSSFDALTRTLALNGVSATVRTCPTAVGDTIGRGRMVQGIADNAGGNTLAVGSGDTPITTLDHLLDSELPRDLRVALIKIDVEGAEVPVLRGSRRTIETNRPLLCVELMKAPQLRSALASLTVPYAIVDVRGWSPTWLMRPVATHNWRVSTLNAVWGVVAALGVRRLVAGPLRVVASWLLRHDFG